MNPETLTKTAVDLLQEAKDVRTVLVVLVLLALSALMVLGVVVGKLYRDQRADRAAFDPAAVATHLGETTEKINAVFGKLDAIAATTTTMAATLAAHATGEEGVLGAIRDDLRESRVDAREDKSRMFALIERGIIAAEQQAARGRGELPPLPTPTPPTPVGG